MNTIDELLNDIRNDDLPRDESAFEKIKTANRRFKAGARVGWYFKDDLEQWQKDDMNPRSHTQYSGIIVPAPDIELRGIEIEAEDCVIVMTNYPCEKCYPESTWFTLRRLLDNPELVEVFLE